MLQLCTRSFGIKNYNQEYNSAEELSGAKRSSACDTCIRLVLFLTRSALKDVEEKSFVVRERSKQQQIIAKYRVEVERRWIHLSRGELEREGP